MSEVALALPVLHGRLGEAVVGAGGTPLGQPRRRDLGDDLVERRGRGLDRAGARAVADGAVAHRALLEHLVAARAAPRTLRQPHPVAAEDLAPVAVVDRRQRDPLALD